MDSWTADPHTNPLITFLVESTQTTKSATRKQSYSTDMSDEWICSKAEIFVQRGFCSVENIFSVEDVEAMNTTAMENFRILLSLLEINNLSLGIGIKNGWKEIVQRHPNRYEMTFRMSSEVFKSASENPVVLALVTAILGPKPKVINVSVVISLPQAQDQSWHSDGPHLSLSSDLPCHCLNVFIPLVDIDQENGPTSIRPESHLYTRDLKKLYMRAFAKKKLQAIESPCLSKGSILLFDYRYLSMFCMHCSLRINNMILHNEY